MPSLSPAAAAVLSAVRDRAALTRDSDRRTIERRLEEAGLGVPVDTLCASVVATGRVTLNFRPDRLLPDGRSVAQALAHEGVYRSQYETKISNGGLTAYPGGDRDEWERRLFAGAYQVPGTSAEHRPKYGGLNLARLSNGSAPFFGSCALVLGLRASPRSTFLLGDSSSTHSAVASADAFEPVLAALLDQVADTGQLLGRPGVTVKTWLTQLLAGERLAPTVGRILDDYIETHTHGAVHLGEDADALLLDPSYRGTDVGEHLLRAAERWGLAVSWHSGSALGLEGFPVWTGPRDPPLRWQRLIADGRAARLAQRVIRDHGDDRRLLTPAAIGRAGTDFVRRPALWREWDAPDPRLTNLKDLEAILTVYGASLDDAS